MIRPAFMEALEEFKAKARERMTQLVADLHQRADTAAFDKWASTQNGSARLIAFHDAVSDADDTLEAVDRAISAEHYEEARHLIALGRESLAERITELKDLL